MGRPADKIGAAGAEPSPRSLAGARPAGRRPLLSFVVMGRNDDYMGNYRWRIETGLNYLADNLRTLGRSDDAEVVFADWGSEVPLHAALKLNSAARKLVRYLLIPPAVARQLGGDSQFPAVLPLNAGIRRARGEFVAMTCEDILFPRDFLAVLFAVLEGRSDIGSRPEETFIEGRRRSLTWHYVSKGPAVHEMDWLIRRYGWTIHDDRLWSRFGGSGMQLMHRRLWAECTGYDERMIHVGWSDNDLGLRITRKYSFSDLTKFHVAVYHLEHYRPDEWRGRNPPVKLNPQFPHNAFAPNGEQWGLIQYAFEEFTYPPAAGGFPPEDATPACVKMNPLLRATIARLLVESVLRRARWWLIKLIVVPLPRPLAEWRSWLIRMVRKAMKMAAKRK